MMIQRGRILLATAAVLGLSACGGNSLGQLGDILGAATGQPASANQGQLAVEIQGVDTQRQMIQVRTQDGQQTGSVRFDDRTVVVYNNQQYPVTALERGDLATITVQDVQGTTYVSRVDVQRSVQDRPGSNTGGQVMQLSGRVAQVNQNAGTFVVQTQSGNVTISLPYNPPQATLDYFRRLRNGDTVRLEATPLSNGRAEIHRFL